MPQAIFTLAKASYIQNTQTRRVLLDQAGFTLEAGEVVGVVGRNGSGKTSLLRLCAGEIELDTGERIYANGTKIALVSQETRLNFNEKIEDLILRAKKNQADNILNRPLRELENEISNWKSKTVADLSGGENRLLDLYLALSQFPDLLLLDEPTNHLDINHIELLEKILKGFAGAVLVVSHDRYFLDRVANRMLEIYQANIFSHEGNYSQYINNKLARLDNEQTADERRRAWMKRELRWVRAGVKARGTKDKGRLQRFEEAKEGLTYQAEPPIDPLLPEAARLGHKILKLINLDIEIGDKKILKNFNFEFQAGTRLGLVGPNGSGKTTVIKTILGQLSPTSGKIVVGLNTEFNLIDQNRTNLNPELDPFTELGEGSETTSFGPEKINVRGYLKRFAFDYQRMHTPIGSLSGGEKARVALAKTLKQGGNFLILDEPTNDLDLETISALEESINNFNGCAILVSHDRFFLNHTCNWILELQGDGFYDLSSGNYDQHLGRQGKLNQDLKKGNTNIRTGLTAFTAQKLVQAHHQTQTTGKSVTVNKNNKTALTPKELREYQKELQRLERQIARYEERHNELKEAYSSPDFYQKYKDKLEQFTKDLESTKINLSELEDRWLEIQEILGS